MLRKLILTEIEKKQIQVMEICGQKKKDIKFIDDLRTKYPKIKLGQID